MTDVFIYFLIAYAILSYRDSCVDLYKITYYERFLKDLDVDISHIEKITFMSIFKKF